MSPTDFLLEVKNLSVDFLVDGGRVKAARNVSFGVRSSSVLAIVGESGCGKSVSVMSLLGLIPRPPAVIQSGQAWFDGQDLMALPESAMSQIRGNRIAMIFQDPMAALNPTMRVGRQVAEPLLVHQKLSPKAAMQQALELLQEVRIADPAVRAELYPFAYSGGMLQRVMIATSLVCKPRLLIADEPTTALDVTIQAQILSLLRQLKEKHGMSVILITHDLSVVAEMADDVVVMYAGQVVESGTLKDIFEYPAHPYTVGLKASMPTQNEDKQKPLKSIEGAPPDLYSPPAGCSYFDRCPFAMQLCEQHSPPNFNLPKAQPDATSIGTQNVPHMAKCWLQHPKAKGLANADLYRPGNAVPVVNLL